MKYPEGVLPRARPAARQPMLGLVQTDGRIEPIDRERLSVRARDFTTDVSHRSFAPREV